MKKEDLKKGDILKIGNHKHKILAVVDYLYFLSKANQFDKSWNNYTIDELNVIGHKVKSKREFKKGDRVLVRFNKGDKPERRYFSHKKNGKFFAFFSGTDEWSSDGQTTGWRYCELAEDK